MATEASLKLKVCPTARAMSRLTLPGRMWRQMSQAAGGCVPTGPGHPHRTLCVSNYPPHSRLDGCACCLGGPNRLWNSWRHNRQAPNVVPTHSVIHIACLRRSVNQSIEQNKHLWRPISRGNQTLVTVHRDHPPPSYSMPWLPAVNLIIG